MSPFRQTGQQIKVSPLLHSGWARPISKPLNCGHMLVGPACRRFFTIKISFVD